MPRPEGLILRVSRGPGPPPCVTARVLGPAHGRDRASSPAVSPSKARRSSMSSCGSGGYFSSSPTLSSSPPVPCNPKSVLKRPVTSEELLTPGAPYARKTFTVGPPFGFSPALPHVWSVSAWRPVHVEFRDGLGKVLPVPLWF
ncbi:hypothetical protein K5549_014204 [Capra hircus]|nr:hypothetical protein K5549_014204 [Capra hircus]